MVIIQFRGLTTNIDVSMLIQDSFLHETKESDRKKRRFAPRSEILNRSVCVAYNVVAPSVLLVLFFFNASAYV